MIKLTDLLKEEEIQNLTDHDLKLERGKKYVLEAETKKNRRGLIVELLDGGGYNVEYWYKSPDKIYPAEIKVDGEIVSKNGKLVFLGFHPELGDYEND